jgi:putative esterase
VNAGWSTIEIGGKHADIYDPPTNERPAFGILHLHDLDLTTLRDNPVFTSQLACLRLACICPHGFDCWWTDRIYPKFDLSLSSEKYLLTAVLPFFNDRWNLEPPRIGVQGVGMGGQGALRLAFKHSAKFPVVGAIAPALDYHELFGLGMPLDEMYASKESCRQDTALMHVPPVNYPPAIFFCVDPADSQWYRGNDRLHEKLNALGVPHEIDFATTRGGHLWAYFNSMAERLEKFMAAGLLHESRRLL